MTETTTDLRIVKTEDAIREAFTTLLEEKGFASITVKDITAAARINRCTFYAHYESKYDLLEKYEAEILREMGRIAKQEISGVAKTLKEGGGETSFSATLRFLQYVYDNRRFMRTLLSPKGDSVFQDKVKKLIANTVFADGGPIRDEALLVKREYLASYFSSANLGVLQQWLDGGCREQPQEISHTLSLIMARGVLEAAGIK